jgi:hypothetical protein
MGLITEKKWKGKQARTKRSILRHFPKFLFDKKTGMASINLAPLARELAGCPVDNVDAITVAGKPCDPVFVLKNVTTDMLKKICEMDITRVNIIVS